MYNTLTLKELIVAEISEADSSSVRDSIKHELDMISAIRKDLKTLEDTARQHAVDHGCGSFDPVVRTTVPNLSWWKKASPDEWQKYCEDKEYLKFSFK